MLGIKVNFLTEIGSVDLNQLTMSSSCMTWACVSECGCTTVGSDQGKRVKGSAPHFLGWWICSADPEVHPGDLVRPHIKNKETDMKFSSKDSSLNMQDFDGEKMSQLWSFWTEGRDKGWKKWKQPIDHHPYSFEIYFALQKDEIRLRWMRLTSGHRSSILLLGPLLPLFFFIFSYNIWHPQKIGS